MTTISGALAGNATMARTASTDRAPAATPYGGDEPAKSGTSGYAGTGEKDSPPAITTDSGVEKFKGKLAAFHLADRPDEDLYEIDVDITQFAVETYKLPQEDFDRVIKDMRDTIDLLQKAYTRYDELGTSSKLTADYATVTINGKLVASVDNQGCLTDYNGSCAGLLDDLAKASAGLEGPAAAAAITKKLTEFFGQNVKLSSSAITQQEFETLSAVPQFTSHIDFEAMQRDPLAISLQNITDLQKKRAEYLASLG